MTYILQLQFDNAPTVEPTELPMSQSAIIPPEIRAAIEAVIEHDRSGTLAKDGAWLKA